MRGTAVLIASLLACGGSSQDPRQSSAVAWNRWEATLTGSTAYENPYRDVTVSVTYTGPEGQEIEANGYWDGDDTFRLRFMFPSAGKWIWKTTCSDAADGGLHDQSGTVTVAEPSGDNPLHVHGYPKVSEDGRYLTYADGTPFLWMGDTAWAAPIAATLEEWKAYVDKRRAQRFNVIQVHTGSGWVKLKKDRSGNPAFLGSGGDLRWNPAYWRRVDEMVKYANDQGALVFFAAVRQPGEGFPTGDPGKPDADEIQIRRFARMLVARMTGSFVVFSPVADDVSTEMADWSGSELAASSSMHLVTAHPRFRFPPAETFHGKAYTDFAAVQTGSGWTFDPYLGEPKKPHSGPLAIQQAIEWPLALHAREPRKPVLNLEIPYDTKGLQDGDAERYQQPYPSRIPRSAAYASMLSGAKGITYGCSDVWSWGIPIAWDGADFEDFETALNQDSATQMTYMFGLFSDLAWWDLVPRHELVQNQSAEWLTKMVVAATPDGKLGVAYLPDNGEIALRMDVFSGPVTAKWFDPQTNAWEAVPGSVASAGVHSFAKPGGWDDAVLVLSSG